MLDFSSDHDNVVASEIGSTCSFVSCVSELEGFDEVDVWLAVVDHFVRSSKLSKSLARCAVQDCDGLKEGKRP